MSKTGYVWEEIYTQHIMGPFHPESPRRLERIKEMLERGDFAVKKGLIKIPARPATKEELSWVHDIDYINSVEKTKGRTVALDPDTTASPKSYEAALMAAGGVMECVKKVISGEVDNAFAFVRPPGHHAEKDRAMGFCLFNNVAIAAEYALKKHGLKRIVIVDFDVHHGNGTENAFYDRSDVFYISTHRWPFYPGTGSREDHGTGEGQGRTLNIPFVYGADDAEFKKVYKEIVMPVIEEYKPDLILVSAGYDAHEDDPLGGLRVATETYTWLAERLVETAKKCCGGRIIFVLEGGYNVEALGECVRGALGIMVRDNPRPF